MYKRMHRKRALALVMSIWMAAVCAVPALAAPDPIGDGVVPTCDEAYYATLDYYGNLVEGSVVKSYALNGASGLTDYGVYDQVVNLTDGTPVQLSEGQADFRFDQTPGHFYFEGKTAQPFQELPWTVALRYYLNGVPARAEDLAGEKGVVEIEMDLIPNQCASAYARYNYTLEAMALFNEDDILSMEAPGAQVQLVGNLRTVLFMALPGEEEHFTIRVGSNDFSFNGMTMLMVPATLGQLEEIAKLSQRKDELEEDYRALSGSIDAMLDALSDIQSGLYDSANGLDRLNEARATISGGKGTIYGDVDALRGDLSNLAGALDPVQQRTQVFSQAVTEAKGILGGMTDTALTLKAQLDSLDAALEKLENGTGDVKDFMSQAAALKGSMNKLQKQLDQVELKTRIKIKPIGSVDVDIDLPNTGGGIDGNGGTAAGLVTKVEQVHGAYEAARGSDTEAAFTALLILQGKSEAEAKETAKGAAQLVPALDETKKPFVIEAMTKQAIMSKVPDMSDEAYSAYIETDEGKALHAQVTAQVSQTVEAQLPNVQKLNGLRQIAQTQSFQKFCENLPGVSASQAKQMADLWTIKAGGAASASFGLSGGLMAGALAGGAILPDSVLAAGAASNDTVPDSGDPAPATPADPTDPAPTDPAPAPTDPAPTDPAPAAPAAGDQTVGGAAVDIIASGLDQMTSRLDKTLRQVSSSVEKTVNDSLDDLVGNINRSLRNMNGQLDDLQNELDGTLKDLARPTAALLGELGDVCAQLDELTYLLDDAADASAALRGCAPAVKSLLDQMDGLRTMLDRYEPTVQAALSNAGALSACAAGSLRDLEALLADSESLMRTSGAQLDEGTRQTLQGLSQSLRKTGKALSTTTDVKNAKNALADIIEDTWHEYTGDVNNILMMDAGAQPVSLTDTRNPAPSSVQILLRTQEIKQPESKAEATALAAQTAQKDVGFWGRIAQMFRDLWASITGIFH